MGFDCGFDIYPRLEATAANQIIYQRFLEEITKEYGEVYEKEGRRSDGKVLTTSTESDPSDKSYIWFMVGECPHLPSNPNTCDYFLRFSSKISGGLTSPAEPYIRGVYKIAKKYFGGRVHFWHEMNETGDERQYGYYDWRTINDTSKKLKEQRDLIDFMDEGRETTLHHSASSQCTSGVPRIPSQGSKQDGSSSQPARNDYFSPSSPLGTDATKNAYVIRPVQGKGQGLFATSKIHKGTRILSEAPIFKIPRDEPDIEVVDHAIIRALKILDRDHQRAFFGLHNAYGKSHTPFLGIARTNALPLGSEAREVGIFLDASRCNHSCQANAQNTWNASIGCLTIHALRDIEEGQEITISYLGRRMEFAERQVFLKAKFFFDCSCDLCTLSLVQREKSDLRLRKIQFIDDSLGESTSDYDTGLYLAHTLLHLLEEEGICDAGVPRVYYDAFQMAIANGDEARAKIFAERAYAARVLIEGDDNPDTAKLRTLTERPSQHPLYQTNKDSPPDITPPREIDQPKFDDWLWRRKEWSEQPVASSANDPWDIFSNDPPHIYGQFLNDGESESFDSLSTSSIQAALFRSLSKSRFN
ncbi:hypothetical protein J7337_013893 [Fusarium musae]|uniref:SET domain-containing protein n=1 Tax=Fusarium musae TaxID=1042133 RepID=A0A9P8D3R8_9HYPO|nr:hypothetical protein J7337_013893 [Fusarium musae]KAG9494754.1 hypothetical protein J7337_013893 [Fusarium musae]